MQLTANQEQKLQEISQKAQDIVHDVKHRAESLASKASEKVQEIDAREMIREAGERIKKHPMQSLAIGAAVGGLLGAMLAHQRKGRRA
ncbi:DUF883 family protein [bacterium]|nr:DUF883 family protein [bacterium]